MVKINNNISTDGNGLFQVSRWRNGKHTTDFVVVKVGDGGIGIEDIKAIISYEENRLKPE